MHNLKEMPIGLTSYDQANPKADPGATNNEGEVPNWL